MGKVSLGEVGLAAGSASVTKFTYTPGMAMTPHTHTGRTSIVIMVSEGTTHANENAGPETLVYVEVNITGTVPGPAGASTPPTK
jgi:quercetin dioxygenase-like cupin family protein